ncbi:hypothetical protein HNQ77_000503 [Silvibacterium bohemicum]|uniref:Uncharacterized protein n=1 Tax=Silvibacterium bohemicum TaxID=1577686 RepID=A0A841JQ59_9BACT|nr:hypothetical protein [Silvibacterium bohemicum]MBB6142565.1 hypothetical protein [Silvibacterium bohemicum]
MAKPTEPRGKVNPAEKNSSQGATASKSADLTGIFRQVEVRDPSPSAETPSSPLPRTSQAVQTEDHKTGAELTQPFRKLDYSPGNGAQTKTAPPNDSDDLDAGFTALLRTLSNDSDDELIPQLPQAEPESPLDGPGEFTSIASRQIFLNGATHEIVQPRRPEYPPASIPKTNGKTQPPAPSLSSAKPAKDIPVAEDAIRPPRKVLIARWVPWVLLLNLLFSLIALLIVGALSLRFH